MVQRHSFNYFNPASRHCQQRYDQQEMKHATTSDTEHAHGMCRLGFDEIRSASELCTAAAQGNSDLIRRYIKAGINVNAADYDKRTALHIAAAEGNLDVVRSSLLIRLTERVRKSLRGQREVPVCQGTSSSSLLRLSPRASCSQLPPSRDIAVPCDTDGQQVRKRV